MIGCHLSETEKALYSSTVCTIIFSTGEALPLSVYGESSSSPSPPYSFTFCNFVSRHNTSSFPSSLPLSLPPFPPLFILPPSPPLFPHSLFPSLPSLTLSSPPFLTSLSPDQWNQDYILFLLDTIEQPPSSDKQDRLPDAFMNVVLAYNQHFQGNKVWVWLVI